MKRFFAYKRKSAQADVALRERAYQDHKRDLQAVNNQIAKKVGLGMEIGDLCM